MAYGTDLYRYAMWICGNDALAKDLVQETYLRAWKALDSLNDLKAAKSWLITILRREYARTFERKVPKFTDVEDVVVVEDRELEPEDRVEIRQLRQAILKLAAKYREPLLMQVVLGYSCEEIAGRAGHQQKCGYDAAVPGTGTIEIQSAKRWRDRQCP